MPKEVRNPEIIIIQEFLSSDNFGGGWCGAGRIH